MRATATNLENHRVKLVVEIDAAEIDDAVNAAARELAQQINVKGFRKGKAPRALVEAQIGGPQVLRAEALQSSIPDFYAKGVADTLIDPIAQPSINIVAGEESGDVTFEAEVEVRPDVEIGQYKGLSVTIPSPLPTDAEIEAQIDRLRETDSELVVVDRGILNGDHVTMSVFAQDPANEENKIDVDDYVYIVGSGSLTEGVDELILGLKTGEVLEVIGRGPDNAAMPWKLTLKQVRERVLPELTDEWVEENTEWASVDALRDGVTEQLKRTKIIEAQMSRRDATLLALSELVAEDALPESLILGETDQRIHDLSHRLQQQKLDVATFLRVTNQTEEDLIEVMRTDAKKAVRIDLALRALIKAEGLEATEDEINEELETTAEAMGVNAEMLRTNLHDNGRVVAFRAEVGKLKASRWLFENVTYVDDQGATIDASIFAENQADAFSS